MNSAAYVLSIIIGLIASVDAVLAISFYRKLCKWKPTPRADKAPPWVTVVLSLRGSDPFLRDCLDALVQLDYDRYDIRVVVDRPNDPASEIVQAWYEEHPHRPITIEFLTRRATTCSLKCSALVQVITSLRPETDVVAFLDADVIPHATWLRELVAPFEDKMVGAVSGCRWYLPASNSFGAILRSQWNSAATAIMVFNNIAWGGCLALRKSAIRPAGIVERWNNALTEDIMLTDIIRHANLQLRIMPELMMVNQETCTAAQTYEFVRRQMFFATLYSGVFRWRTRTVMLSFFAMLFALLLILIAASLRADWGAAAAVGLSLVGYALVLTASLALVNREITSILRRRGMRRRTDRAPSIIRQLWCLPISHLLTLAAIASTYRRRHINWRGINYRVSGAWTVRRLDDAPFAHTVTTRPDSI